MRAALRLLVSTALLALGAALPGGCGAASSPAPTTVRGLVQFQNYPLAGGLVVFAPDAERGTSGKPVQAGIAADGSFQLQINGSSNIPPGWYRVAIADPPLGAYSVGGRQGFPPRLRRPDRTDLHREVQAGKENVFEFRIEAPGLR